MLSSNFQYLKMFNVRNTTEEKKVLHQSELNNLHRDQTNSLSEKHTWP